MNCAMEGLMRIPLTMLKPPSNIGFSFRVIAADHIQRKIKFYVDQDWSQLLSHKTQLRNDDTEFFIFGTLLLVTRLGKSCTYLIHLVNGVGRGVMTKTAALSSHHWVTTLILLLVWNILFFLEIQQYCSRFQT